MFHSRFEKLYINCELGNGDWGYKKIRKTCFLFDSNNKEYLKIWKFYTLVF